ncbi:glutamate racemase [Clostridium thermobutyricum]|uniref:glutamate racemase n=1 Tax=Clostridium thermobutyricum TaxID=29372 RepID=UPI0018AC1FBC|nr:glutamate racemase [Clostridium thermobutyricum]
MDKSKLPIGFFDSGVGGLSVLKDALKLMPNENYIFFGDSKNAPYGDRSMKEIRDLTFDAVDFLFSKNVKAIVVACNTATSAAVAELRRVHPEVPIVGIEPAVKPAVELNRKGKIVIMATAFTLKQDKFAKLVSKYDHVELYPMPCPGLVEFIEAGDLHSDELKEFLRDHFKEVMKEDIAAIVLGCTHYPFIKETLASVVGKDIPIIDGGEGTVRELRRRLSVAGLINESTQKGTIEFHNSCGREDVEELSRKLLGI